MDFGDGTRIVLERKNRFAGVERRAPTLTKPPASAGLCLCQRRSTGIPERVSDYLRRIADGAVKIMVAQ